MSDNGNGPRRKSAYQQQVEREQQEQERTRRATVHQAGGGQGVSDFFSKEHRYKPITRGEFLGWLELLEYSRKASSWWRRLGRLVTRTPGPQNLPRQMARAYWLSTLKPALEATQAELDKQAAQANAEAAK